MNKSWQLRVLTAYLAMGAPLGASCAKAVDTLEDEPEGSGGSSTAGSSSSKSGSTGKGGATGAFGGTNAKSGSAGEAMADGGEAPVAEGGEGTGGSAGSSGGGGTAGAGGGMVGVPPDVLERASVVLRSSTSEANASTTKIFVYMFLVNQSDDPLPLANVKVRYWFTSEAASPQLGSFHKGTSISSYTNTFVLDAARSHILTTFGGNTVEKGDDVNESEFQLQIEGGAQNQSNDWSFEPSYMGHDGHMPNAKITVYLDDKLIWGCEPDPGPCFDDVGAGGNGAGGAN